MKKLYIALLLIVAGGALYALSRTTQELFCSDCGSDHGGSDDREKRDTNNS